MYCVPANALFCCLLIGVNCFPWNSVASISWFAFVVVIVVADVATVVEAVVLVVVWPVGNVVPVETEEEVEEGIVVWRVVVVVVVDSLVAVVVEEPVQEVKAGKTAVTDKMNII